MARGPRHHDRKKASCPKCYGERVEVASGQAVLVKGIEKAQARCLECSHTWLSENRAILARLA
jgi:Zn finger protein HypA/HybF involved in hydrogenase expression